MSDSILQITEQNGDLVVDSRLIAARLDIEHDSFMRTIKKYEKRIEQRFGIIRFEIGRSQPNANGAVHEIKPRSPYPSLIAGFRRSPPQKNDNKIALIIVFCYFLE